MEAAGLAVGIPALARQLAMIVDLCRDFNDAPKELTWIQSQLLLINAQVQVIDRLQQERDASHTTNLPADLSNACEQALDSAKQTITSLKDALEPHRTTGLRARLHWSFVGQSRTKKLLDKLRSTEVRTVTFFVLLSQYQSQHFQALSEHISKMMDLTKDVTLYANLPSDRNNHAKLDNSTPRTSIHSRRGGYPVVSSQANHYGDLLVPYRGQLMSSLSKSWSQEQTTRVISIRVLLPFAWLVGQRAFVLNLAFRSYAACSYAFTTLSGGWIGVANIIPDNAEVMKAAAKGDLAGVRELFRSSLASASDTTIEFNYTPLTMAIESGNSELVEFLLRNGANVNSVFGRRQTTPLAWALRHRQEEIVRLLLEKDADISFVSAFGWTPMFYLWTDREPREKSTVHLVKMLTSKDAFDGSELSLTDIEGWDMLHRAAAFGAADDVQTLIALGARLDCLVGKLKWRPIHQAAFFGNFATFQTLLPYELDGRVDRTDERGWTLLHIAASAGNDKIVRYLIQCGSDPFQKSEPYWSHIPETLYGGQWTPAEVAKAQSQERYEAYTEALIDAKKLPENIEYQDYSIALEYQSEDKGS